MAKTNIKYREKYNKGRTVNKKEILRLMTENLDKMVIEMRERSSYSDGTEELIISIRF